MKKTFIYEMLPARVLFGAGQLRQLPAEAERLGVKRMLVISTPEQARLAQQVSKLLGSLSAGTFTEAAIHTPADVTDDALLAVLAQKADCVIGLGGGSTISLGKAITLRTGLPQIAVPTTYAGSEMTPMLGETRDGASVLQHTASILPKAVIYDVELTLSLPATFSCASGMNALAHAAEALYAQDGNPLLTSMAEQAIAIWSRILPRISQDPSEQEARQDALYAAWLCGICLGSTGMALHHHLCHLLSRSLQLPHAETHAVLLPYVLAYNCSAAPEAVQRLAAVLGTADAVGELWHMGGRLGLPRSLRELGMAQDSIERAAELALQQPCWNPHSPQYTEVVQLIRSAWDGSPPHPV